jgi:phosphomannomutase
MEALMIGVSGMRGTVGGTLTPEVVVRMTAAFATWLKESISARSGLPLRVVFGRDTRPSGYFVRDAVLSTLHASGIQTIDLDVVTTPGVAMMVKHLGADAGIVATASHNPIEWNGVKFLTRDSVAPAPVAVSKIKELYSQNATSYARVNDLVAPTKNTETHAYHTRRVLDHVDVLGISTKRFKVVLDSVNGAGCVPTVILLSKLGCQIVHLNGEPTGQFAHEPEPTESNLTQLSTEVKRHRAHVGFAQDPDADRLAIVDENGRYIGEEYSLALCAKWILSKRRGGIAVANLSTSRMLDDIAAETGATVIRTPTGEANVIDAMLKSNATIGGEGNGGVIDPRIVPGRDSLVGIAYVLQLMAATGKTLSQLVGEIPGYEIVKTKFECRREDADRAAVALCEHFRDEKIDTQDGIRVDFEQQKSWVNARPSNTEPIMRIIAEAPDRAAAVRLVDQVRVVVDQSLKSAADRRR